MTQNRFFQNAVCVLVLLLFGINARAAGDHGGNTSGGGDLCGVSELSPALEETKEWILKIGRDVYSRKEMRELKKAMKLKLKLIALDGEEFKKQKAAEINGLRQTGSAYSVWFHKSDEAETAINKDAWVKAVDRVAQLMLLNHEFCVIAGIEESGAYQRSIQFGEVLRKRIVTDYEESIDQVTLYSMIKSADGKIQIQGRQGETEFRSQGAGYSSFTRSFAANGIEIYGCISHQGYLAMGAIKGSAVAAVSKLGKNCESLNELLETQNTNDLLPFQIIFDPSRSSKLEGKGIRLDSNSLFLSIQVLRH